jgi:hypothetical protein
MTIYLWNTWRWRWQRNAGLLTVDDSFVKTLDGKLGGFL